MNRLDYVIEMLERTLGTSTKRHILGGALVSMSLMFGGLALTVMTLKTENKEENPEDELQVY
jgi:hypothetical protein